MGSKRIIIAKILNEFYSIESTMIDSIEDYNNVIFNEDMSECLIGDTFDWKKGLKVGKINRTHIINDLSDGEKKLARVIILFDKASRKRIVLVVNSILGVVTNPREGMILVRQRDVTNEGRLSKIDITNVFMT